MKNNIRVGAWGAFARAAFNIGQFFLVAIFLQFIPDGSQYDPAIIREYPFLFYIEFFIMVGMAIGLLLVVRVLYDLMKTEAPDLMWLSLATAAICAVALFMVGANSVTKVDSLFVIESYSIEQQGFALRILDMVAVLIGHLMVSTQALSTLFWSLAAWRTRLLPKALAGTGIAIGIITILFEFTPMNLLGFLIQMPLFIWLGIALWRKATTS